MRKDDIFEAMTDIDDRFIEAARPLEMTDISTATAKPAPRRAMWKSLVSAAAFVAVATAAGVVGVNYIRGRIESANPAASISNSIAFRYPDEAKYIVDSDINTLTWGYPNGSPSWIDDHVDYANSYEELAEQSDLIVSGIFIDDIHQMQDVDNIIVADGEVDSYNTLEIDRVIKGDVSVGDFLIIHQSSTISRKNTSDGKYQIFCLDQLSPMFKGDKWIYFLKLEENGTFSPVNGPQGRYPLPDYTNRLITSDGETPNVDEFSTYKNAAPAREEIYEELLKKLAEIEIKAPGLENIRVPEASFTMFAVPEFRDVEFNVSRLGVSANDADVFDMKEDETLENLYLADLNGDGKRELCATISGATKRVAVCDYKNELYYTLDNELDGSLYDHNNYYLSTDTGTDYITSYVNNEPCWIPEDREVLVVNCTVWRSPDLVTTEINELTLDMMRLVGEAQEYNQTFSNEAIAKCENDALTRSGKQGLASLLTPGMWHTGEYDINDDGEQELLISLFNFTNMPGVFVYDKNCEYLGSFETEKGRCTPELINLYEDENERFWYYNGAECPEVVDENGDSREIYRQGIYKIIADENGFSTERLIHRDVFFKNGSEEKSNYYIDDREVTEQDYIELEALYDRWCWRSYGFDLTNPEDWKYQQRFEDSHVRGINMDPLPDSVDD